MEIDKLYRRSIESDTETPRQCHLWAMYAAFYNQVIPADVYDAVLNSAVLNKDQLREVMDQVNETAFKNFREDIILKNMVDLSVAIVRSYGSAEPKASERRLAFLTQYLDELIFSELYGKTE